MLKEIKKFDDVFQEFTFGIQKVKDKKNVELQIGNYFEYDKEKKKNLNENSSQEDHRNAMVTKKISLEEAKNRNKELIEKNPYLQKFNFDDRTLYNKKFMLEVSMSGYDANDTEDVENYVNGLPSKQVNRNEILAGVNIYNELGQSEYEDNDLSKFIKVNKGIKIERKTSEKVYLTDVPNYSLNDKLEELKEINFDFKDIRIKSIKENRNIDQIETEHRQRLAKQFGSEKIELNFSRQETNISNENLGIVKSSVDAGQLLELIKEFKALGFTTEEIKYEIQNKFR